MNAAFREYSETEHLLVKPSRLKIDRSCLGPVSVPVVQDDNTSLVTVYQKTSEERHSPRSTQVCITDRVRQRNVCHGFFLTTLILYIFHAAWHVLWLFLDLWLEAVQSWHWAHYCTQFQSSSGLVHLHLFVSRINNARFKCM